MKRRGALALLPLLAATSLWAQRAGRSRGGGGHLGSGFGRALGCPPGAKQIRLPGQTNVRCVMDGSAPAAAPAPAESAAPAPFSAFAPANPAAPHANASEAPLNISDAVMPGRAASTPPPTAMQGYTHIMRPGVALDLPKGWRLLDAWKDSVPTLYLELDAKQSGKQLSMVVAKIAQGQEGYLDMQTAISREKRWQNAKDGGRLKIGGLPAQVTYVPHESRTAYVAVDPQTYYTLIYSAPSDLYDAYHPAFKKLVESFQVSP